MNREPFRVSSQYGTLNCFQRFFRSIKVLPVPDELIDFRPDLVPVKLLVIDDLRLPDILIFFCKQAHPFGVRFILRPERPQDFAVSVFYDMRKPGCCFTVTVKSDKQL